MSIATGPEPIPDSETAADIKQLAAHFEHRGSLLNLGASPAHRLHVVGRNSFSSSSWFPAVRKTLLGDTPQPESQPGNILSCILPFLHPGQSKLKPRDWVLLGEFATHGAEHFPIQLADALRDLDEVVDEAEEEGFPTPKEIALDNAKRLLREVYAISPRRFEVYPMPDGEVAIDAPDGKGSSVLLLCDSEGGALCLVNMKGKHRRARYSTTETLPDGFIREAMAELERQND